MQIESDESAVAVGKRLKLLRVMAGLSRLSLAQLAGVSKTSISYWEHGTYRSISPRSLKKILEAAKEKGVICSESWLISGVGEPPKPLQSLVTSSQTNIETNLTLDSLSQNPEITEFLSHHSSQGKTVILKVEHNGMSPFFEQGDILGGVFIPTKKLTLPNEAICIVKINGKLDVRKIRKGSTSNNFNLSYFAYDKNLSAPFELIDIPLESAAPIIRMWR